jgi:hypothetical protein
MSSFPFLAWIFFGIIIYLLFQQLISCYRWRLQHTHRLLMLLLSQLPQQQWGLITLPLSFPLGQRLLPLRRPSLRLPPCAAVAASAAADVKVPRVVSGRLEA